MQKQVGLAGATATVVGFVIGTSIFVLPAQLAGSAGPAVVVSYGIACCIALLLCITVPLAATSAIAVPAHCAPQHSTERSTASASADCCDTDQGLPGTSHSDHKSTLCKAGLECKSCPTFTMAPTGTAVATFAAAEPAASDFRTILSPVRNPTGLWRPPRAV